MCILCICPARCSTNNQARRPMLLQGSVKIDTSTLDRRKVVVNNMPGNMESVRRDRSPSRSPHSSPCSTFSLRGCTNASALKRLHRACKRRLYLRVHCMLKSLLGTIQKACISAPAVLKTKLIPQLTRTDFPRLAILEA